LDLLRGLMDSDGHATPRGACEFYQKSREFIESVRELLSTLGIKNRIREKIVNGELYHTLSFSTIDHVVFGLDRKNILQEKCMGHPKNEHHYIHTITKVDNVPVRCIEVEHKSHMFLCSESMIPTHNTQCAAGYVLWWACFKPDQKILILSKDHVGAKDILSRFWYSYEELPWWIKPGIITNDVQTKKFDNGTEIKALATTESSGRGMSISLLYLDEFSFVRPGIAEAFWTSIFPVLAAGGKCIITSTPNTDEDKFAKIWLNCKMHPTSWDWQDVYSPRKHTANEVEEVYETMFATREVEEQFTLEQDRLSGANMNDDSTDVIKEEMTAVANLFTYTCKIQIPKLKSKTTISVNGRHLLPSLFTIIDHETFKIDPSVPFSPGDTLTVEVSLSVNFSGFFAPWTVAPEAIDARGNIVSYRGEAFKKKMFKAGFTDSQWNREFACSFISSDPTLISPAKLAVLKEGVRPPKYVDRWGVRWFEEIYPNTGYLVVLDPSEGVDADDAVIQVWEHPSMIQVAEWNNNKADQPTQAKMLKRVLETIYSTQNDDPDHDLGRCDIYYSIERNGLGMGIISVIDVMGPETFPGNFVDATMTTVNAKGDPGGFNKPHRWRGLWTSVGSKRRYGLELKSLIERNLFVPRSDRLVSQLKTFVRTGPSWRAKEGSKDDIVMSCVLMMMLIDELRIQEPELDDMIRVDVLDDFDPEDDYSDENNPVMPLI